VKTPPAAANELPIAGYLDRLSARPGERIAAKVSVISTGMAEASLVRLIHVDPNPAGPGMKIEDLSSVFRTPFRARRQEIRRGASARVDGRPARKPDAPVTWTALVQPTRLDAVRRAVLCEFDAQGASVCLDVSTNGAHFVVRDARGGERRFGTDAALAEGDWYRIWASYDPARGRVCVGQLRVAGGAAPIVSIADARIDEMSPREGGGILIAASHGADGFPARHFDGRIERPTILQGWTEQWTPALAASDPAGPGVLASWDFAMDIASQCVRDIGPERRDGVLVNLPVRAVRGADWRGDEMCWRHAPGQYAAIHFHADALGNLDWETDFEFEVPAGLRSGAYALRLTSPSGEVDTCPFYVLPPKKGPFARIAFLAPTFTYQAYANHARGNADAGYRARAAEWGAYPWNPDDFPIYGRSTYNKFEDGAGICFSSRLRPMLTMRPGFLTFVDERGSGLRHFPADSHLLDWLENQSLDFDVITDEDLDREGLELLRPYRVVLTGSHPEYHTSRMLDALRDYVDSGGRLIYLGGNGFYWRIATSPEYPGALEVRRGEGGIRAWAADPGEYYHQFDGAYGGLWRRNGRPPQSLVGIGFSAQGLFEGSCYRRTKESYEPRWAWLFDGIESDTFGDHGLSGGGAAGFELDRLDRRLGSPPDAVVLARSEGHSGSFVLVPEEHLTHVSTVSGEPPRQLIRGELVYFEKPGGGAVLSVGSITFCGSLSTNSYANDVSRLLRNAIDRFVSR
jgi:N,N-dimethylformamidase